MQEIELAYWAGFLDGDGSIGIKRVTDKMCKRSHSRRGYRIYPCLQISQVNRAILEEFKAAFGAGYIGSMGKTRKSTWRKCYKYGVSSTGSVKILKQLLPYLRLKKRQAEILIRIQELKHEHVAYRGKPKPDEYWTELEQLVIELAGLNKKRLHTNWYPGMPLGT